MRRLLAVRILSYKINEIQIIWSWQSLMRNDLFLLQFLVFKCRQLDKLKHHL